MWYWLVNVIQCPFNLSCIFYFGDHYRVVQRNLVFVVGLSPRLADVDVLKKHEYFGKFGKMHKVVINPNTSYAGSQVSAHHYYSQL